MTGAPGLAHLWRPYTQMRDAPAPLEAVATHGARIRLADGRELIDGIASWWTACHGYNHPHIVAAMRDQLDRMPHVMFGGLTHEPAQRLAGRLAQLAADHLPGRLDHVFFSDSGSVAVEVALKMAVQHWVNRGVDGRTRFVSFHGAYHGDTMGAMAVSDAEEGMHKALGGWLPSNILAELPCDADSIRAFDALLARHRDELAAVIVEPLVQGAGGMRFHDAATLRAVSEACRAHDVLLIADEVFTGLGRTGAMLACGAAGVAPDILCLSKALTGGALGLAATLAIDRVYDSFLGESDEVALMHGPTYMANPLGCAAANASLDLFETEDRLGQVATIARHLTDALEPCRALPGVADVRVLGAIGVVQLKEMHAIDWLKAQFVARGVWLRPFGDIVYTTPPFSVTEDELSTITDAMVGVLTGWSERYGKG